MIREGMAYRERADISVFVEGLVESLFVEIVRSEGKRNIIVGVVYRPPGANLTEFNSKMKVSNRNQQKRRSYEVQPSVEHRYLLDSIR